MIDQALLDIESPWQMFTAHAQCLFLLQVVDKRHMIVLEIGVHNWINMNFQAQMIAKTNYYHLARYYRLQNEAV